MTFYLSRLSIARKPSVDALKDLIDPEHRGRAMDAQHRLIWSAFASSRSDKRDYLWRADGKGRFYVLSSRPPAHTPLFEAPEVKVFEPQLAPGDRLQFTLRVNATKDRPARYVATGEGGRVRHRRVDVVMDALHGIAPGERAAVRMDIAQQAGSDWLVTRGQSCGFRLLDATVADYRAIALPDHAGKRAGQPQFGIMDIEGRLEVTDPKLFLGRVASGFGRARAFGCGLMLIRRAA